MPGKKTSFTSDFASQDLPIDLTTVISSDNFKQAGENFAKFVELVNSKASEIRQLTIVDSSYLRRHYDLKYSDHRNQKLLFSWRDQHQAALQKISVKHQVISWFDITTLEAYSAFHKQILQDFSGESGREDAKFREIVTSLAKEYVHKGVLRQTVNYILDECTGALVLTGHLTYPGKLNTAISYVLEKYHRGPKFIAYKLSSETAVAAQSSLFPAATSPQYFPGSMQTITCKCTFSPLSVWTAFQVEMLHLTPEKQLQFSQAFIKFSMQFLQQDIPESKSEVIPAAAVQAVPAETRSSSTAKTESEKPKKEGSTDEPGSAYTAHP